MAKPSYREQLSVFLEQSIRPRLDKQADEMAMSCDYSELARVEGRLEQARVALVNWRDTSLSSWEARASRDQILTLVNRLEEATEQLFYATQLRQSIYREVDMEMDDMFREISDQAGTILEETLAEMIQKRIITVTEAGKYYFQAYTCACLLSNYHYHPSIIVEDIPLDDEGLPYDSDEDDYDEAF